MPAVLWQSAPPPAAAAPCDLANRHHSHRPDTEHTRTPTRPRQAAAVHANTAPAARRARSQSPATHTHRKHEIKSPNSTTFDRRPNSGCWCAAADRPHPTAPTPPSTQPHLPTRHSAAKPVPAVPSAAPHPSWINPNKNDRFGCQINKQTNKQPPKTGRAIVPCTPHVPSCIAQRALGCRLHPQLCIDRYPQPGLCLRLACPCRVSARGGHRP